MSEVAVQDSTYAQTLVAEINADASFPPEERARRRLHRLTTSFAVSLRTIADMYADGDWKFITREDGTSYSSLTALVEDVLDVSQSMARRYVQGARDFYLPLSAVTVEGTRIEITSKQVRELGQAGLEDAVHTATERVSGVDDPAEAAQIISGTVTEVQEARQKAKATVPSDVDEDDEDEDERAAPAFDGAYASDPLRYSTESADTPEGEDADAPTDAPDVLAAAGGQEATAPVSTGAPDDEFDQVLAGAVTYEDPKARMSLPQELRHVVSALYKVLDGGGDAEGIAALVDFDSRGVLVVVSDAIELLSEVQSRVETSPWFMSRIS